MKEEHFLLYLSGIFLFAVVLSVGIIAVASDNDTNDCPTKAEQASYWTEAYPTAKPIIFTRHM